ncbi:GYD domain-containing protein [Candidatus Halocynthiibacter alkanivorans]|uniref:GYD domain-containing protein n=1 Tax=Candidatus Halocynthiibacter alkanivorans TaxID=2267619 RepID=UPI000DF4A959|nr:GYD domain-containing protein [Candidatus Halocynthiibacter alkanivorans]
MATYIVTGNYTSEAIKGLIAAPSDRSVAVKSIVESAGGSLVSYLVTTGESDFSMVVSTDDVEGMLAVLMVAGASGGVCNLKTIQAFSGAEFEAAQKRAGGLAAGYKSLVK